MRVVVGVMLFISIVTGCFAQGVSLDMHDKSGLQRSSVTNDVFTASGYKPGILKHIVLFKYKQSMTQVQRDEVVNRFLALKRSKRPGDNSPYILSIVEGVQNSGEGVSGGFEQGFIVTFKSEGDRNFYVGKPLVDTRGYYDEAHDAFKQYVGPLLSEDHGVLVFDFSPERMTTAPR